MRIETDKYLITQQDELNFVLQLKHPRKDSSLLVDKSKIGELILGQKTYYPSLDLLAKGLAKYSILESDEINSFNDIKDLIQELIVEVRKLNK